MFKMLKVFRFLLSLLLIDFLVSARKLNRRENYLSVPPPPASLNGPAQQSPATVEQGNSPYQYEEVEHGNSPYQYEEVHPDEFPLSPPPLTLSNHKNHQNQHTPIQRYESDLLSFHHANNAGNNFLIDNGLRSIAKGSADQALGAVASQNAAGKQASYVAKSTLAQAAAQAASTAVTALKGKEILLRRLEEQSVETHKALEGELAQLHQAKRSAKSAQYSAQQAINHVSVLTAALNNAQAASELAQKSASEAAAELSSQIDMVAQAKTKLEQIESQLYAARLDYEETKEAAEKATLSAQEAHINANDAAAHANIELSDSVAIGHNLYDKSDQEVKETKRDISNRSRNRRRNPQ